jgi:hypothetical protein
MTKLSRQDHYLKLPKVNTEQWLEYNKAAKADPKSQSLAGSLVKVYFSGLGLAEGRIIQREDPNPNPLK